jgi:plasmid stabilization system protein ParE
MALPLSFAPAARDDIERARAWLTQHGAGPRARSRLDHLFKAIRELAETPHIWPESPEPGMQQRVIDGYVIVYRAFYAGPGRSHPTRVQIARVFGPGQLRGKK